MKLEILQKVKLTKMSDNRFNNQHPNNINEGYIEEGELRSIPEIGEPIFIGFTFNTSPLISLPDENGIFKTLNSTYKIELI